jgi:CarD family transcriptional regulator
MSITSSVFNVGDYVVYPAHGVGKLLAIESHDIAGQEVELFVINFDKDRMTLRLPVNKAQNAGLRPISTRGEFESVLQTLTVKTKPRRLMWSRRAQEYENKINSGNPVSIAEVVRDLFRSQTDADQSYSERQIYQAAMDRLARELAAVEAIDENEAISKMESIMRAA